MLQNRTWLATLLLLAAPLAADDRLPGTAPLPAERDGQPIDWAWEMVGGIDQFLDAEIAASVAQRARHWNRDISSADAYWTSTQLNRVAFDRILGGTEPSGDPPALELVATVDRPALVARTDRIDVFRVRWPALPGVHGEGLWLVPRQGEPVADIVALPDADQSPEWLAGLESSDRPQAQFARRLAESGCRVLVPVVVDRQTTWSRGVYGTVATEQPHREFIYRQAFEMGRHVIGYEVAKVRAAVDWLRRQRDRIGYRRAIGVAGYGEGGLIALHATALDRSIDASLVSGYFAPREQLWQEPIYRNVFGLFEQLGDAEIATLVAPRSLIVEACQAPEVAGREHVTDRHLSTTPGRLTTPDRAAVRREADRARQLAGLREGDWLQLVESAPDAPPGSTAALSALLVALAPAASLVEVASDPITPRPAAGAGEFNTARRMQRQVSELVEYSQALMRDSERTRNETFWKKLDTSSLEAYARSVEPFRRQFYDEVIGRFDRPLSDPRPRTRKIYDEPAYTGYEVVLDVFPGVIAYGHLLVPKDLQPGQRRPVVVCQHGLEGRPAQLTEPGSDHRAYHRYAGVLAERGYVTYSPQNPYIFFDRFRTLQRKLNPLGKTLFSIIVPQHQQTVDWLASLEFVDRGRIGFYGLSYGGKTAMRVPPLVDGYCLSICSGDFNEWIWKNASSRSSYSYLHRQEYEIFEFNLGPTFNYAEMAALIAPRPFMVERGHRDGVAPDEWVAYEFAKVRRLYADLKRPDRAEIEFFDGPHTIHGVGTFEFLDRHLRASESGGVKQ